MCGGCVRVVWRELGGRCQWVVCTTHLLHLSVGLGIVIHSAEQRNMSHVSKSSSYMYMYMHVQ